MVSEFIPTVMVELKLCKDRANFRRVSCFKAAEAALGESYGNHAYSVFSIGSQNNESELDAVE
jgi:hypothetical protein